MKFIISFSEKCGDLFKEYIYKSANLFTKSGVIMTIDLNNNFIRITPDPFSISDFFKSEECLSKAKELYGYYSYCEYLLIKNDPNYNSTETYTEIEISTKNKDSNDKQKLNVCSFRFSQEQFQKFGVILKDNFKNINTFELKSTHIPEGMKKDEQAINYIKNGKGPFLYVLEKSQNNYSSVKSGIFFKPLKIPYSIKNYEQEALNNFNKNSQQYDDENLGIKIFETNLCPISYLVKMCNKVKGNKKYNAIDMYIYKEKENEEKIKNILKIVYNQFNITLGYKIDNEENQDFIYTFKINGDIFINALTSYTKIKISQNFLNTLAIWSKYIILSRSFLLENQLQQNNGHIYYKIFVPINQSNSYQLPKENLNNIKTVIDILIKNNQQSEYNDYNQFYNDNDNDDINNNSEDNENINQ